MRVKLSDHIDLENGDFSGLTTFWDTAIYLMLTDELGRDLSSEQEFVDMLTEKGKSDYQAVKEENPEWIFPNWLNEDNE